MTRSSCIGLLVGLLTGGWMWLEYVLGLHTTHHDIGRWTGALSIVVPLAGIALALMAVRREQGRLRFPLAMQHGIALSAAAAMAMAGMSLLYAIWLNPAWAARAPGGTAAGFALQAGASAFVGGAFLSALVGWFLARRPAVEVQS